MSPLLIGIIVAGFSVTLAALIGMMVRFGAALGAMQQSITRLDTQVSPFWAKVQAKMSEDLHHPHPRYAEMDGLLERLEALTITPPERVRLKALLEERAKDMHPDITDDQRAKATVMIQVMAMVIIEATGEAVNSEQCVQEDFK